jgi:hypothetical protein
MKAYNSAIANNPDKKYGGVTHTGILQKTNVGGK